MKLVAGMFTSLYDLERVMLSLEAVGFHARELRWCELNRQQGPQEPRGLLQFLRQGGFLGDTIDRSDRASLMDGTSVGATMAGLVGIVWGSRWPMGPITGGVLGMLGGGLVGWLLDQAVGSRRGRKETVRRAQRYGFLALALCRTEERIAAARSTMEESGGVLVGQTEMPAGVPDSPTVPTV